MTEESIKSMIEFSNSIIRLKASAIGQLLEIASSCEKLKDRPENKPLYHLNLLDIVPTLEPHTSKFISSILSYTENGRYIILESFIERFLSLAGLDKMLITNPQITAETSHVDIRILDKDYAIIIENKLMNAPFQRNQLGRYIESTHQLGYKYENIFLVLLPQFFNSNLIANLRASVWKCPPDGLSASNDSRVCSHIDHYNCWCDDKSRVLSQTEENHCRNCKNFRELFACRSVVVHSQLSDWLFEIEQIVDSKQTIFKSALHQFADFTQGLFNIRINNHLLMDIQKLIKDTIIPEGSSTINQWNILHEKLKELSEIQSAMSAMKNQLSKDLIDAWYHELQPEFACLHREVQKSFGINIKGVWVGCWCGSDNNGSPYWGFYCENKGNAEQQAMVNKILSECDMRSSKSSANYISWNSTRNGAERCRRFYRAAQKLGFL